MELKGVGLFIFIFCFNILAYVYVSSYGENIRVDNGCYKLVSILIGYVMNTLMNEGKMVRGEEKHGCC